MVDFTSNLEMLERDFASHGIPTELPGFYNHEAFLRVEQQNSEYLNNYARYVALRAYDVAYLSRARLEIPAMVAALHTALLDDGRQGACVDTSAVLSKSLEHEGYWNYVVKGSLTIEYPATSGLGKSYFWTVDEGEFTAAHAWISAPPFSVVDVTIRQQGYTPEKRARLPASIIAEAPEIDSASIEDVIAPAAREYLEMCGVPREQFFQAINPCMVRVFEVFPACKVVSGQTKLKYVPTAVTAPDCSLEEMIGLSPKSRGALEIYEESIVPALKRLRG